VESFKGSTRWLTPREKEWLKLYPWPAYAVPVLSGLFLAAWAAFFRGRPMRAHAFRTIGHGAIATLAMAAYLALQHSSTAREKAFVETPHVLWLLVIGPLALFHLLMAARRLKLAVEMSD
jgi:hypothetical protein